MENGSPEPLAPEPKESRLSRFLARRWAVPAVIAGAVTVVTVACLTPDFVALWQLSRERDRIRARGEPATLAELAPEMPPDDENGAALLVEAFELINATRASEPADWAAFIYKQDATRRADAEKALKLHAKAMALAREAFKRPTCVFDIDYTGGVFAGFGYIGEVGHLQTLLRAEASVLALKGERDDAATGLCAIFTLAEAVSRVHDITVASIGVTMMEGGIEALEHVEGQRGFGDAERKLLIARLASLDWRELAEQHLMASRIQQVDAVDALLARNKALFPGRWTLRDRFETLGGVPSRGVKVRIMRIMTEAVEAARLPPWRALPVIKRKVNLSWRQLPDTELGSDIDTSIAPSTMLGRATALRDAAILGLSCELFRSAKGKYPGTLDELAPDTLKELPPDPFTGKPFRYELRDGGRSFIVYSVGPDLEDDGGAKDHGEKDDISWEGGAAEK